MFQDNLKKTVIFTRQFSAFGGDKPLFFILQFYAPAPKNSNYLYAHGIGLMFVCLII